MELTLIYFWVQMLNGMPKSFLFSLFFFPCDMHEWLFLWIHVWESETLLLLLLLGGLYNFSKWATKWKKVLFFRFGSNEFRQVSPTSSDLWSIMFLLVFVLPFNFDFFISGWNQMTEIYIWCTHTHTHTHTHSHTLTHTQIYYVHL
jgi:hypothetical protein